MSFKRLKISVGLDGTKLVGWEMERGFRPSDPVDFYVDRSRTGGPFAEIGGPVTDACLFADPARFSFGTEKDTWYRVRYMKDGEWVYSIPTQAVNGQWTRQDWLAAKEVVRREYARTKSGGSRGLLLKRKLWGTVCTECADWSTSEPSNGLCHTCLGTGLVGGFYPPVPLLVDMQANYQVGRRMTDNGLFSAADKVARFAAYPFVSTGDVWAMKDTDDRYVVNEEVAVLCEMKSVPVIFQAKLKLLPKTDIMHGPEADALLATEEPELPEGTGNTYTWYEKMGCERY